MIVDRQSDSQGNPEVTFQRHQPTIRASRGSQLAVVGATQRTGWLRIPSPSTRWRGDLTWGHIDQCFTPAFWAYHAWQRKLEAAPRRKYSLGRSLIEEVAACLLGGHGMPAELGLAAFTRVRDGGLLTAPSASASNLERALREPFEIRGRSRHYRFPAAKARALHAALLVLAHSRPPTDPLRLRDWLLCLPGIGPKTASWIVRNRDASTRVAVLDIHILRACQLLGAFPKALALPRDYMSLEAVFVSIADSFAVCPSDLDVAMWHEMRASRALVSEAFAGSLRLPSRVASVA